MRYTSNKTVFLTLLALLFPAMANSETVRYYIADKQNMTVSSSANGKYVFECGPLPKGTMVNFSQKNVTVQYIPYRCEDSNEQKYTVAGNAVVPYNSSTGNIEISDSGSTDLGYIRIDGNRIKTVKCGIVNIFSISGILMDSLIPDAEGEAISIPLPEGIYIVTGDSLNAVKLTIR